MKVELESVVLRLPSLTLSADIRSDAQTLGIFGASGAGKTTLLEIVAGLRAPERGRIAIGGHDLTTLPARERRIGYVPQDETLFPHLSVRANLAYGARRDGASGVGRIAALLEIDSLLGRDVGRLSGGERRRVALGRALAADPAVLLLDEPLTGLDAPLRRRMLDLLLAVRHEFELPFLFVSHEREEVIALCDEVAVLDRGSVIALGTPAAVL
jgi:ABC-type molybdate transport system ATPase subunit